MNPRHNYSVANLLGRSVAWLAVCLLAMAASQASAQQDFPDFGDFGSKGGLSSLGSDSSGGADKVELSAQFSAATDDRPAMLFITADIAKAFHVFAVDQGTLPEGGGPQATDIQVDENAQVKVIGPFKSIEPPKVHIDTIAWEGLAIREHFNQVTWYAPLQIAADADLSTIRVSGQVSLQACDPNTCIPYDLTFAATLGDGFEIPAETPDTTQAFEAPPIPLLAILGYGLLGGLILNLMPCVLPVIGLKVMSFAKQGGESRARILGLNLAYSAGLLSVFLVLAVLATLVQTGLGDVLLKIGFGNLGIGGEDLGWGELFTLTWFKVAMTGFVFAMALSFLGIWELPIPGFATSGKATKLTTQEGPGGAFFMGVFTTLLATPCSGPFLGPVFGYTLGLSTGAIFLIFLSVGLGMSLPYLLIGMFPSLVSWLPKPGAWMDTFKNLMGFVLLATVVYLFTTLNSDYFIATLTMLVGIWFACWWIGRTPVTAAQSIKNTAWVGGLTSAALVGFFAFKLLTPGENVLPWQPYTPETLAAARAEGKTVLVDFTANWCLTCKTNLKLAINRQEVLDVVEENDVVTLLADWTDRNDMIKDALTELNSRSIPLLAVYPADADRGPIVLPDLLTQDKVLEALAEAGPSKSAMQGLDSPPPQLTGSAASTANAAGAIR